MEGRLRWAEQIGVGGADLVGLHGSEIGRDALKLGVGGGGSVSQPPPPPGLNFPKALLAPPGQKPGGSFVPHN